MKNSLIFFVYNLFCILSSQSHTASAQQTGEVKISFRNDSVTVREEFNRYFENKHAQGDILILDLQNNKWFASDAKSVYVPALPASTFKIINLLIALETKVIADENQVVKWIGQTDTVKYGYRPDIYRDMTVKEAFEKSAGWVFVELSKKIGKKNYQHYLSLAGYGNADLSEADPDFWNFGNFGISPYNQVDFLRKLYLEQLPFKKRHMQTVKRVMLSNEYPDAEVHAKTGWTRIDGLNIGWWVGYIEKQKNTYLFATRLFQDCDRKDPGFGPGRKEITRAVLEELRFLNFSSPSAKTSTLIIQSHLRR
ncbi:penicillin-binding transpeptidase domain-containing protein [Sphingobacterium spiritivorum]|nr:penicillin-binding transpeptidase domain-containing protein [Sphingobacterium spiritivorum]WQD32496.1 penicillin-binding transpeptidase domain-containing protein [Sphingobacterium spiritivorum]SUJ10268.1 Beta-lactamase OXA-10 precursor [Sphingobacterium spiritivorum]